MIDINLLPPHLGKARNGSLAKAALLWFVLLLLLAIGAAAAHYTFRVIPALAAERDRLLEAGKGAEEEAGRVAAAGELRSGRIVWSRALGAIKTAAAAVNGRDPEAALWVTRIAAGMGALGLEGYTASADREKAEALVVGFPAALAASEPMRDAILTKTSWSAVPEAAAGRPGMPREACSFSLEAVVK